jgi:hypothetical protein
MTSLAVASALRAHLGSRVPTDLATAVPALWPHQVRGFRVADVLAALWTDRTPASYAALRTLLPDLEVPIPLEAPRPSLTPRPAPRLHLLSPDCPHPEGTPLARNWRRYREGATVKEYRDLGGNPQALIGDVRRGLVRVG